MGITDLGFFPIWASVPNTRGLQVSTFLDFAFGPYIFSIGFPVILVVWIGIAVLALIDV
jgi:hypothetical protein